MITPGEARNMDGALATEFEERIDAAIRRSAADSRWPCTIALNEHGGIAERVAAKYRMAGWRAEVVRDQRDGDFLRLERP